MHIHAWLNVYRITLQSANIREASSCIKTRLKKSST